MNRKDQYVIPFKEISISDIPYVGGKNASLGEMIRNLAPKGIRVPDGFAVTSKAYWHFLDDNKLRKPIEELLNSLDTRNFTNLVTITAGIRGLLLKGELTALLADAISNAYDMMCQNAGTELAVAVRSSATAEDLPGASFAGQQESYLNITGEQALLASWKKCVASLFTERAVKYRIDRGFDHMSVALSVGVQTMVRSDLGCAGVAFTLEPDTGFRNVVVVDGAWGLGENVVKGNVDPDEFVVFKPSLLSGFKSIVSRKCGKKQKTMVYADDRQVPDGNTTVNLDTSEQRRSEWVLADEEVEQIARWSMDIESHYQTPMDIEWAKDGADGKIYIVQARPETVHAGKDPFIHYTYHLKEKSNVLIRGTGLGNKIASGKARILHDPGEADKLQKGEVLVTGITNPDWDPVMKKAAAIITDKGGRTSHAAIVARELGVVAVVGSGNATEVITDGQMVTVSCAEGSKGTVYEGALKWEENAFDTRELKLPQTEVMLILADPDRAFQYSFLPNNGVGLMRMEFVVSNTIRIHPMALVKYDELTDAAARDEIDKLTIRYARKEDYFVDRLTQAVATVAAAFYPRDVIVRMSDFKTNEYANLVGGKQFEPVEENPMLGFRGASRYYSPLYRDGFKLECDAMKRVRDEMGLTNVKLMIPFCRTVEEGKRVVDLMAEFGLIQGKNGLEIYTMIEVPSNVILAEEFAGVFDGFSIGSNDLTQLTLGLDRDSELVSGLFDENNRAVTKLLSQVIRAARKTNTKIGLCGQAPSDHEGFARLLVEEGIDSISFNPDALIKGIQHIHAAETEVKGMVPV